MTVYVENLKEVTKKTLELISDYNRIARNKVNTTKSLSYIRAMKKQNLKLKTQYLLH